VIRRSGDCGRSLYLIKTEVWKLKLKPDTAVEAGPLLPVIPEYLANNGYVYPMNWNTTGG